MVAGVKEKEGGRWGKDNWAGVATFKCSTCMYFVGRGETLGRCRAHAPTMKGFPVVYKDDWCGDHKLDESKLSSMSLSNG